MAIFDNFDNFDLLPTPKVVCVFDWKKQQKSQNCQKDDNEVEVIEEKVQESPKINDVITTNLSKTPESIDNFRKKYCICFSEDDFEKALNMLKMKGYVLENPLGYIQKLE